MDQIVLVTVEHSPNHLTKEGFGLLLRELPLVLHISQELPSLQILHDDGHLHVLQGEAIVHLHNIFMVETFQNFSFDKNVINICCRSNHLGFDCLDGHFLLGYFVLPQQYLPKPSFPQFLHDGVLPEATGRIEILPLRSIYRRFIFDIVQILLKVLPSLRVEEPEG